MKGILKITIPLTIISFAIFTKWWYVLPVDGTDKFMIGFPLPYERPGVNSMSFIVSIRNLIIDFLFYFCFWYVIFFGIYKFIFKIRVFKFITILLWIFASIILSFYSFMFYIDGRSEWKKDFEMEVMETGYRFIWEDIDRPDYYKYHPEKKKK